MMPAYISILTKDIYRICKPVRPVDLHLPTDAYVHAFFILLIYICTLACVLPYLPI